MSFQKSNLFTRSNRSFAGLCFGFAVACGFTVFLSGCHHKRALRTPTAQPSQTFLHQIEYPDLCNDSCTDGLDLLSGPPITLSNFHDMEPWNLSLDECVLMALQGSKVIQRLGGVVVNSPQAAQTTLDPAIIESNPLQSVEAALSAFDANVSTGLFFNHNERSFNNLFFGGGAATLTTNASTFQAQLQKRAANGATFTLRNQVDYNRNDSPVNLFRSAYDILNLMEVRQPLGRGSGTLFNRIAGPNALPGQYNGVLLARLRSDVTLADFEAAVRNLVRDVERNYWELYFAYRDVDTKIEARELARDTWEKRKLLFKGGLSRPDDEAQARQQYFNFDNQVINALTGQNVGQLGLIGAERNLRRLLGLPVSDGRIIRPSTEPVTSPVVFDWDDSQHQALDRRVELRRQKWVVRQRELELIAAKEINRWQFDLVGQYGFRGFGDNLFGSRSRPNGSAFDDLINGDLDDWQLGFELGGPIGQRQGHLAVRNACLNLNREKIVLREQQKQILHDLSASMVEIDRAFSSLKSNANNRIAIEEELQPKKARYEEGEEEIFFLLDVRQRRANVESSVHRSIVDYNQALLEYAYSTGSLLSRYNIFLSEGEWCNDAQCRARVKAARTVNLGCYNSNGCDIVAKGPHNQTATFTNSWIADPQAITPALDTTEAETSDQVDEENDVERDNENDVEREGKDDPLEGKSDNENPTTLVEPIFDSTSESLTN